MAGARVRGPETGVTSETHRGVSRTTEAPSFSSVNMPRRENFRQEVLGTVEPGQQTINGSADLTSDIHSQSTVR